MFLKKILWNHAHRINSFTTNNPMWLINLQQYGYVLLDNIQPRKKSLISISKHLGIIRDSPYGDIWDTSGQQYGIKTKDNVYKKKSLELHTDMNYMVDTPKWQVWITKKFPKETIGGESILADGMCIYTMFDILFPYHTYCLENTVYKFQCSEKKNVAYKNILSDNKIHFNMSDMVTPDCEHALVLNNIIHQPYFPIQFRLQKNQALIIDNHRILHGRTSFEGERNLMGCYVS